MAAQRKATAPQEAPRERIRADVCVIGSGIVGLINTLAMAKRGLSVVCVDQPSEKQLSSYKVGESLLIYTNAFLRVLGELDDELNDSFHKAGFWMAYGMEGRTSFDENVSEWAFESELPQRWIDNYYDPRFARYMFQDSQIVRPEIEAVLRDRVRNTEGVTYLDRGLVREVDLGSGDGDHLLTWMSRDRSESGEIAARWIVDCSGRAQLLAKKFGHDTPLRDDFSTTAAWAQFQNCTDDLFDERWQYEFADGVVTRRDRNTLHLWGENYWIWIIRLTGDRVSVGVSYHRGRPPEDGNARDVFWKILRRYPVLDWLREDDVLEFSAYKDVQHITDTFVSDRRYAMVGDSSSIIDAYYSQGISLSMVGSWHIANIAMQDVKDNRLDTDYIDHVNNSLTADWRIMRSMVQSKYSPAIADSRFFLLDHLLDLTIFGAAMLGRFRATRWLLETDGRIAAEKDEHRRLRSGLTRRLYLSQSAPFHRLDPQRVATIVENWHKGLERRAVWRLEHGEKLPSIKSVQRAYAALPELWRLPFAEKAPRPDLSMTPRDEPEWTYVKGNEYRPPLMAVSGTMLVALLTAGTAYDIADTQYRKLRRTWRGLRAMRGRR
ncbi:NAD(P)/FAD-dependent oxidoreductase [Actinacidiphila epipremni]|uniref:FAD-dependent oxidoreductase n=1 Tax=Actinacidiphila epipremni TaxID=2053013 RepID=A0ABX0ZN75_9ACTN|nr:FAD-dependent oxidoreductase [Actinacidiphila epipremni]NJP45295.1 FAD-dependent oxidoreductase [Actinacidiphila epipremni]